MADHPPLDAMPFALPSAPDAPWEDTEQFVKVDGRWLRCVKRWDDIPWPRMPMKGLEAGTQIGHLTVVTSPYGMTQRAYTCLVRCVCGKELERKSTYLRRRTLASCGCKGQKILNRCKHPLYRVWTSMWTRCTNPKCLDYSKYGGRGITICERWSDFEKFVEDMGPRPAGATLDRIDNDGPYEPGNCRWATRLQQQNNRSNNVTLTLDGKTYPVSVWVRITGIKRTTILHRLERGWTVCEALTLPVGSKRLGLKERLRRGV